MKTKQIHASTMQEAMAIARRELGEDVILIDQKKATSGKGITVTFAVDMDEEPLFDEVPATQSVPRSAEVPRATAAKVELDHPALAIVSEALSYHALPTPLIEKILLHLKKIHLKPDSLLDVAESALAEALMSVLAFKPIATASKLPPPRALMLVGPHGAGKTSAIAKLAAELTMHKQPLVMISTDLERLSGTDSLQKLSDILKCEFRICENRAQLKAHIATHQSKSWVLIDSTGANIYEFAQLKALGELATLQGIEPVLTCPAGMDAEESREMASVFSFLNIERMIVTRLDAARRLGSLFAAQTTGGYALSNFSSSARPADACIPISAAALARLMLRHERERLSN